MRETTVLVGVLAVVAGCADTRTYNADGRARPDPSLMSGEVVVAVHGVEWTHDAVLEVDVLLLNGPEGDPLPQDRAAFFLETDRGERIDSLQHGTCSASSYVAPGTGSSCTLGFALASRRPTSLHYSAPDGRTASAPIPACSPAEPGGLCLSPEQACHAGSCVARCSPAHPSGHCERGMCVSGSCVACTSSADCPDHTHCASDGLCYASPSCSSDSDCRDGTICGDDRICALACTVWSCATDQYCARDGRCYSPTRCETHFDCAADAFCVPDGFCALVQRCTSDDECAVGDYCRDGTCHPPSNCTSDRDCPTRHYCGWDGICYAADTSCASDHDCPSGAYCAWDGTCYW